MSLEAVVSFWQKVQSDERMQAQINPAAGAVPRLHGGVGAGALERLTEIARKAGFECSAEEFASVEAVIRFWDEVRENVKLQRVLSELEDQPMDKASGAIVALARSAGYNFSEYDLRAVTVAQLEAPIAGAKPKSRGKGVAAAVKGTGFDKSLRAALNGGWTAAHRFRLGPGAVSEYM